MCTPCGLRRTPRSAKSNTRSLPWKPSRFPRPLRGGREPAAMGYRGKVELQEQARVLRARGKTLAQIEALNRAGKERIGILGEEAFFVAGLALYAGEGGKTDGLVRFANSDPEMVRFFCAWLRRFFNIDESRLR